MLLAYMLAGAAGNEVSIALRADDPPVSAKAGLSAPWISQQKADCSNCAEHIQKEMPSGALHKLLLIHVFRI
jgi:hypothetical protein